MNGTETADVSLRRESISPGFVDSPQVADIMNEAFGDGGWTFDMIRPFIWLKGMESTAYYDGERLIGFSIVHSDRRFFFGIFLAIRAGLRGHGYGSAIMRDVLDRHDGKIGYFSVEAPDDSAPNAEQRRARIRLYERFGLRIIDRSLISQGCRYVCMSNNEWRFPTRIRVSGAEYYAKFNALTARSLGEPVCPKCRGRGSVGSLPFGLFRTICPVCKGSGMPG